MDSIEDQSYNFVSLTESHIHGIAQLASKVWNIQPDENYFRWKYRFIQDKPSGFAVINDQNSIIALSGYWHRPFFIAGKLIPAVAVVDMVTHPDYRGKSYLKIAQEIKKLPYQGIFHGFNNETSRRYYVQYLKRQNSKRIDLQLQSCSIIYRFPARTKFYIKSASKIAVPLFTFLQHIQIYFLKKSSTTVIQVGSIGPEFDRLWDSVKSEYGALALRDSAYLKWRFLESPHNHQIWVLKEENEIRGYMITGIVNDSSGKKGYILDWLVSRKKRGDFRALLATAVEFLVKNKVDRIAAWILDHEKEWIKAFNSLFFIRKKANRGYFLFAMDQIVENIQFSDEMLFVTMGDADYPGPGRLED